MNVSNFLSLYPSIKENNLSGELYKKDELYEMRPLKILSKLYNFDKGCSPLKDHQVLLSRLMSVKTPYRGLFLFHALGTGKTRTAAAICELARIQAPPMIFNKVFVLASSDTLLNNFKNEVAENCVKSAANNDKEIKRAVRSYYAFETFTVFANNVKSKSDEEITEKYSNKIFVIDEVHNLRPDTKSENYKYIKKVFDTAKNIKILILSGTPIRDDVNEIAATLNLVLDKNSQFIPSTFTKKYFVNYIGNGYLSINNETKDEFMTKIKGVVSYLENEPSDILLKFEGEIMGSLKRMKVVPCEMSEYQTEEYKKAYDLDVQNPQKTPDNDEKDDDADDADDVSSIQSMNANKLNTLFSLNSRKVSLTANYDKMKITNIETMAKYSMKFAQCIKNIETAYNSKQSCFVYSTLVADGLKKFAECLKSIYNFAPYTGQTSVIPSKGKRYAIITAETSSSEKDNIFKVFNSKENAEGQIIAVLLGSKRISEGISLKNVQQCHILAPFFNYSEIWQAIGRGFRYNSHADIIKICKEQNKPTPIYRVFQYVSIPKDNSKSIDLQLYELSEKKDYNNKQIERLLKEAAIDCTLFWNRNKQDAKYDNERICDYQKCDYDCKSAINNDYKTDIRPELDATNKNLFYSHNAEQNIRQRIEDVFKNKSQCILSDFKDDTIDDFLLIKVLIDMERDKTPIKNKFGLKCLLKQTNNFYGLIQWGFGNAFESFYTDKPVLSRENDFNTISNEYINKVLLDVINEMFNKGAAYAVDILKTLPVETQELILEYCYKAQIEKKLQNIEVRDAIINSFDAAVFTTLENGNKVSALLYKTKKEMRVFEDAEWRDAEPDEINSIINKDKDKYKKELILGLTNGDEFCIRTLLEEKRTVGGNINKNAMSAGRTCKTIDKPLLISIAVLFLKIKPNKDAHDKHDNKFNFPNKDGVINDIFNISQTINIYNFEGNVVKEEALTKEGMRNKLTNEQIKDWWYFNKLTKVDLCKQIRNTLESKRLTIPDPSCGNKLKRKG